MDKRNGLLVVVSGPSGAGKGTVLANAIKADSNLKYSISVTTRQPRKGEVDGVNYFFKSMEEYEQMIHDDEFLESECVYGNYYGTPKNNVIKMLEQGYDVILEIDVKGALNIKSKFDKAIMIFITPLDTKTIEQRLRGRSSETQEQLEIRINSALDEIKMIDKYDYVVVNEDAQQAAKDFLTIIAAEKCSIKNNKNFVDNLIYGGK